MLKVSERTLKVDEGKSEKIEEKNEEEKIEHLRCEDPKKIESRGGPKIRMKSRIEEVRR